MAATVENRGKPDRHSEPSSRKIVNELMRRRVAFHVSKFEHGELRKLQKNLYIDAGIFWCFILKVADFDENLLVPKLQTTNTIMTKYKKQRSFLLPYVTFYNNTRLEAYYTKKLFGKRINAEKEWKLRRWWSNGWSKQGSSECSHTKWGSNFRIIAFLQFLSPKYVPCLKRGKKQK